MAIDITPANAQAELKQSDKPIVMDAYATWCGPCQLMTPIFEELSKELSAKYKFVKLNVDEARDVSIEYGVTSVPTFVFIKNGEVAGKVTGSMSKDDLKAKIEEHLG